MRFQRLVLCLVACACLGRPGGSLYADWPQWRGPQRDGTIQDFTAPKNWPEDLAIEWTTEVGEGHASPILSGDRLFTFTRQGNREILRCVTLKDGREQWQHGYVADMKLDGAVGRYGNSPRSTPAVRDSRIFALGAGGALTCLDAQSGRPLWQHTFVERFKTPHPEFGAAASPLIVDDLCIAAIGGKGRGALAAFAVKDGRERWSAGSDGPSYASPAVFDLGGVKQIVTQTQTALVGVSLNGKALWSIPFETPYNQNIVSSVAFDGILVYSGTQQPLVGVRAQTSGPPVEIWTNRAHSLYMSSPVLHGELLFGMSEREAGHVFCVHMRTGKTLWKSAGRAGENVSLQRAGNLLVLLNEKGKLTFAMADDSAYKPLKQYQVSDDSVFAHPILSGNRVLIKDRTRLICYRLDGA